MDDMGSTLEAGSMVIVAAFQVGSCVVVHSLEDLNQPNMLADRFVSLWLRGE